MHRTWIGVLAAFATGLGAACGSGPAEDTSPTMAEAPAAVAPADPLGGLVEGLASGRVEVVDLSQPLNDTTPVIQLPPPLANTPGFSKELISEYDEAGPDWYWNTLSFGEHVGTHFDAPCHWASGRDEPCVDEIPAQAFVGPAAVVDVTAEVVADPDFVATRATLLAWEAEHGPIPDRAWVILRTGWGTRGLDAEAFVNADDQGIPHYPGWGRESAEFLTAERNILGVGTEALGTDAAVGATASPAFPNHSIMHGAGKFGLTQLANVDLLPETGAVIVAAPLKIERGSGSPVRAIALVPRD